VPFPLVIVAAALIGWLAARRISGLTRASGHGNGKDGGPAPLIADDALHWQAPSTARTLRTLCLGLVVWAAPIGLVALLTGAASVYTTQGLFFAGTALVTFGGAYAVLAFVAQQAVQTYGWLSSADMVSGLALAETTLAR
jgi:chromate transporter